MPKIFLTGATGFVGGDILHAVATAFPSSSIIALVRDKSRASKIADKFKNVSLCEGDLDSKDIIAREVQECDVVINAAQAKYLPGVENIAEGIRRSSRDAPSELDFIPKVYDDLDGASEIHSLISKTASRAVDQYVLQFAQQNEDKHPDPGPVQVGDRNGESVYVGKGEARWGNVHISDLADLAVKLVRAALSDPSSASLWNQNGLYLVQTGEITWKEIAEHIGKAAEGSGKKAGVKSGKSSRASEHLGWTTAQHSLEDEIPLTFDRELKASSR
ncbi:hypothetical protein H2203_009268 [Taxawa tesnikishii (nom. ined.)]|nr:hypothetical protein H2203_009268 [Dothideales sp. JES 119]